MGCDSRTKGETRRRFASRAVVSGAQPLDWEFCRVWRAVGCWISFTIFPPFRVELHWRLVDPLGSSRVTEIFPRVGRYDHFWRWILEPRKPSAKVRNHSTYLTEKSGPFGGAWTWLVAYLWQLMAFVVDAWPVGRSRSFLPRLWFALLSWHPANAGNYSALICAACAAVAILYVISDLPGLGNQRWSQGRFVTFFLIPLFGFVYAFTTWRIWVPLESTRGMVDVAGAAAAVASLSLLLGMIPFIRSRFRARQP